MNFCCSLFKLDLVNFWNNFRLNFVFHGVSGVDFCRWDPICLDRKMILLWRCGQWEIWKLFWLLWKFLLICPFWKFLRKFYLEKLETEYIVGCLIDHHKAIQKWSFGRIVEVGTFFRLVDVARFVTTVFKVSFLSSRRHVKTAPAFSYRKMGSDCWPWSIWLWSLFPRDFLIAGTSKIGTTNCIPHLLLSWVPNNDGFTKP